MKKRQVDYVCVEKMEQKEFGFVLMVGDEATVEVVVIDHVKNWVRTLGEADSLDMASEILNDALLSGFNIQGIVHQPII